MKEKYSTALKCYWSKIILKYYEEIIPIMLLPLLTREISFLNVVYMLELMSTFLLKYFSLLGNVPIWKIEFFMYISVIINQPSYESILTIPFCNIWNFKVFQNSKNSKNSIMDFWDLQRPGNPESICEILSRMWKMCLFFHCAFQLSPSKIS